MRKICKRKDAIIILNILDELVKSNSNINVRNLPCQFDQTLFVKMIFCSDFIPKGNVTLPLQNAYACSFLTITSNWRLSGRFSVLIFS